MSLCAAGSDVICDFPLKEMLAFHKSKGAEGTILVTQARPTHHSAWLIHYQHPDVKELRMSLVHYSCEDELWELHTRQSMPPATKAVRLCYPASR